MTESSLGVAHSIDRSFCLGRHRRENASGNLKQMSIFENESVKSNMSVFTFSGYQRCGRRDGNDRIGFAFF